MSAPSRWLDHRPFLVVPTLSTLLAIGVNVLAREVPRLYAEGGIGDVVHARRARLLALALPAWARPLGSVLQLWLGLFSLVAFPPDDWSSLDSALASIASR